VDGTHIYYHQNYPTLAYVAGSNGYMTQQQQQQQQHHLTQQNNPYNMSTVYYLPGTTGQSGAVATSPSVGSQVQAGGQFYMHPSGQVVYVPRQVVHSLPLLFMSIWIQVNLFPHDIYLALAMLSQKCRFFCWCYKWTTHKNVDFLQML